MKTLGVIGPLSSSRCSTASTNVSTMPLLISSLLNTGFEQPILLASDYSSMSLGEFQQSMLVLNKLIRVATSSIWGPVSAQRSYASRRHHHCLWPRELQLSLSRKRFRQRQSGKKDNCYAQQFEASMPLTIGIWPYACRVSPNKDCLLRYGFRYFFDLLYHPVLRALWRGTAQADN